MSTRAMLVVAKNSTPCWSQAGIPGQISSRRPAPITSVSTPMPAEATTAPQRLPTPPNTTTMKQPTM